MRNNNISLLETYHTPTTSDIGPVIWRKWWLRHLSHIPLFSNNHNTNIVEMTEKQQKDRTNHIENCKHCQKALRVSNRIKNWSYISLMLITRYPIYSTILFALSRFVSSFIYKMVYGERHHLKL